MKRRMKAKLSQPEKIEKTNKFKSWQLHAFIYYEIIVWIFSLLNHNKIPLNKPKCYFTLGLKFSIRNQRKITDRLKQSYIPQEPQMTATQNLPTSTPQQKRQFKSQKTQTSKSHIYACFEQPQTVQILKYITQPTPDKLLFDSAITKNLTKNSIPQDDKSNAILKRVKEFRFQKIYNRQEKFKFAFSQEINGIIAKLFRGYSQTVFIYGTEQSKKDKILIGESQNAGLLLTTLSEMFEYCHDKEIEDQVTIKISCSMFKDGKFVDPFNLTESHTSNQAQEKKSDNIMNENPKGEEQQFQNLMCGDMIEGKYLLGTPQIIIRNMRTALKIINLITKKIQERRDMKEENTENIIFTIKLELDTGYDRQTTGEVYEYSIPKLYIVKLANPSIDNTLNGVNKNNKWFINLFNFLQNQVLLEKGATGRKSTSESGGISGNSQFLKAPVKELTQLLLTGNNPKPSTSTQTTPLQDTNDTFTEYIRTVVMRGVADIHCFTSINNKMTSNECLTAFIFNNYLSAYQTKPQKTILNVHTLKNEKTNFEEQLMNLFTVREAENHREREIVDKYRAKYGLVAGNGQSKSSSISVLRNTSNTVFGKSFTQAQKSKPHTKDVSPSPKPQTSPYSQILNKKPSQSPYPDPSSIKQTLKSIISPQSDQPETQQSQWQVKLFLLSYIESVKQFMNCFNLVEYEYAQILAQGCERLNKYIFNEEIEEFYYAKKISLEHSVDLRLALRALRAQKLKTLEIEQSIIRKINSHIKKANCQLQTLKSINGRHQHEQFFKTKKTKILTLIKQRDLLHKLFEFYNTMTYHYIYEDNPKLVGELQQTKKRVEEEFQKRIMSDTVVNYDEIMKNIKKGFSRRIREMRGEVVGGEGVGGGEVMEGGEEETMKFLEESNVEDSKLQGRNEAKSIICENNPLQNCKLSKTIQQASMSMYMQKKRDPIQQIKEKASKYKMRKTTNELDNMFTNSNVGVIRPQFQRKNYK